MIILLIMCDDCTYPPPRGFSLVPIRQDYVLVAIDSLGVLDHATVTLTFVEVYFFLNPIVVEVNFRIVLFAGPTFPHGNEPIHP